MPADKSVSPSPAAASEDDAQLLERVSADFKRLASSAAALNAVSDEIAQPISTIDAALRKLNLGVSAWVQFAGEEDPMTGVYWFRSVGYDKVSSRTWGIAICYRVVDVDQVVRQDDEWLFNEAPRAYRLEALDKLPHLLEKLTKVADDMADALKKKVATTKQVATAIKGATPSASARRR